MMVMRNQASRLVLFTICLMYLIFYVDRVNLSTAAPIMQKDLGLTATQLGIAFSAFAYPYAFFQIAGGWLGDRLGPRVTLCLCALLVAGSTIWTGMVGGLVALFVAQTLSSALERGRHFPRQRVRCPTGCDLISALSRRASPTPLRGSAMR